MGRPAQFNQVQNLKKVENTKTHWKKLNNPNYLGAYSLDEGKDLIVTIKSVSRQVVVGEGGKSEECTVAQLEGQKPMILNVTNCKTIASLYKTPYVEEWQGKKIILFVAMLNIKGEQTECLRIRPKLPALLPELTPSHEKWGGAMVAIQQGSTTIEAIRKKYTVSNENALKLQNDAI